MGRKTLVEKTAESIIEYIQFNKLQSEDKLPIETELMGLLGVGRNTLREAMGLLKSRNIIEVRQGAGSYISSKNGIANDPLGFDMVNDREKLSQDLQEIRRIIEPSIAALAAQNASQMELDELSMICDEMEMMISKGEDFSILDQKFHTCIAKCSQNQMMHNLLPIIQKGIEVFSLNNAHECNQTIKSHREIYEAIKRKRAEDAKNAMFFHLMYNENRIK